MTLQVAPEKPPPSELTPTAKLGDHAYHRVLLLPPDKPVAIENVETPNARDSKIDYYMGKVEKSLLASGFEVISSEVVARAAKGKGAGKFTGTEKAMLLGKETKADAVLSLQSIKVDGRARYYALGEGQSREVDEDNVVTDDDGLHFDKDTEACLYRLPHYEVSMEAKLLDARDGTVLWIGNARSRSSDVIQDTWEAELDDDCELQGQNFDYVDFQAESHTLDNVVAMLLDGTVKPLAAVALQGASLEPPKKAEPAPAAPPAPKKKIATVSSRNAALREGPERRSKRKMKVPRKAKVEVIETMGEWYKVKVQDGSEGWMHESTVLLNE
ncbi:MAG: SH3 domain-containing protein [Myxococcales bacterium]|nr:SH3 domain-containing protein [Myxococcales bacterium]